MVTRGAATDEQSRSGLINLKATEEENQDIELFSFTTCSDWSYLSVEEGPA
jgi:hypothetical protein